MPRENPELTHSQINALSGVLYYLNNHFVASQGNIQIDGWVNDETDGAAARIVFSPEANEYVLQLPGNDWR
jgi:hypothetical protein